MFIKVIDENGRKLFLNKKYIVNFELATKTFEYLDKGKIEIGMEKHLTIETTTDKYWFKNNNAERAFYLLGLDNEKI